jgi:CDP-glucose 4,6-dehydratase
METMGIDFSEQFDGVYLGKNVLVTGHTGFKGSWLSLWLHLMGANVIGYALGPATAQDNFVLCGLHNKIIDLRGDIRDTALLKQVFEVYQPDIVFHLAAQPIVRHSYEIPAETFETNVMGTVNVLDAIRGCSSVKAGVIITSDKCYENREQIWGYRENDKMGGYDPYSASKGCAELVAAAFRTSYFSANSGKAIATARAGNVIGGGDWSQDRLIPDCIRAFIKQDPIVLRNPDSVRPWQFVLEPLYGYLLLGKKLLHDGAKYSGAWNFGPDFDSIAPVKKVVSLLTNFWGSSPGILSAAPQNAPHEAALLSLDCTKAKNLLDWKPRLNLQNALNYTVEWYKNDRTEDVYALCERQIASYCKTCTSLVESDFSPP